MNSNDLYITSLNPIQELNSFIINNNSNRNTPNATKPFTAKDYYNKRQIQSQKQKTINEDFVKFLIEEKTHYANFSLSEEFYAQKLQDNYNKFNHNLFLIEEKRREYNEVIHSIENELLQQYQLDSKNLMQYYTYHITTTSENIRIKEHGLECYQNSFKRLYKFNYCIKKRLEDEYQFQETNDKQFEKYVILNNSALLSAKKQSTLLHNFKQFNETYEQICESDINKKTNEYAKYKKEVEDIQSEMKNYEEHLQLTYRQQSQIKDQLHFQVEMNEKTLKDYKANSSEFCVLKGKLLKLFYHIKAKNWNSFVVQINKLRQVNQSQKTQYNQMNKDITELLLEQSQMEKLLKQLSMKTTQRQEITTQCINITDSNDTVHGRIQEVNNQNMMINDKIEEEQKRFNLLIQFMFDYAYKIYTCLQKRNKEIDDELYMLTNCLNDYPQYFVIRNEYPHLNLDNKEYGMELFKLSVCLCKDFAKVLLIGLYYSLDRYALKLFGKREEVEQEEEQELNIDDQLLIERSGSQGGNNNDEELFVDDQEMNNNNNKNDDIEAEADAYANLKPIRDPNAESYTNNLPILYSRSFNFSRKYSQIILFRLNQEGLIPEYKKHLKAILKKIEVHKKAMSRNESKKDISSIHQFQEINKQKEKAYTKQLKNQITSNDLYESYLNHLNDIREKDQVNTANVAMNKTFFEQYPHKSLSLINKYSTHLNKDDFNVNSNAKTKKSMKFNKGLGNSNERRRNNHKAIMSSQNSYEDTYSSHNKYNNNNIIQAIQPINKKEKLFGSSFSSERVLLYFRINDLRKLEINYFKHDNKESAQFSNYNEMYFQFKKKFSNRINKIKKKNASLLMKRKSDFSGIRNNFSRQCSKKSINERNSIHYPQLGKSISSASLVSASNLINSTTTKTMFAKGRNNDSSMFNLSNRIASLDSTNNFTRINALIPNK